MAILDTFIIYTTRLWKRCLQERSTTDMAMASEIATADTANQSLVIYLDGLRREILMILIGKRGIRGRSRNRGRRLGRRVHGERLEERARLLHRYYVLGNAHLLE